MASHKHEDVYIDKAGNILRGLDATAEKLRRDVLDVLQDTGLDKYVGKRKEATNPHEDTGEIDYPRDLPPTGDTKSLQDTGNPFAELEETITCDKDDTQSNDSSRQAMQQRGTIGSDSQEQENKPQPEEVCNDHERDHKQTMTIAEVHEFVHPPPSVSKESSVPLPIDDESEDCSIPCDEASTYPPDENLLDSGSKGSNSPFTLEDEEDQNDSDTSFQEPESIQSDEHGANISSSAADEHDANIPSLAADEYGSNQTEPPPESTPSQDKQCWVEAKAVKKNVSQKRVKKTDFEQKPPQAYATATGVHVDALKKAAIGVSGSVKAPYATASAKGVNFTPGTVSIHGVNIQAQAKASAQATGLEAKGASMHVKGCELQAEACLDAEAKGVQIQGLGFTVKGEDMQAKASANAKAKGVALQTVNADVSGSQTSLKMEATCQAQGGNISAASANVTGVTEQCEARASAVAKGIDCKAAQTNITGWKEEIMAGASTEAKGMSVNAATANITGGEDKKEAKAEAKVVASQITAATANIMGYNTGASVGAHAQAKGADVKAANVSVKGIDSSVSATATASAAGFEANVANVDVSGVGGAGVHASAEAKLGVDAFNVRAGVHSGVGVGVSSKPQLFNVDLSVGMPSVMLGPAFNINPLASGGAKGNDDDRGGKKSESSSKGDNQGGSQSNDASKGGDGGSAGGETHGSDVTNGQSETGQTSGGHGTEKACASGVGAHGSEIQNGMQGRAETNGVSDGNCGGGDCKHGSSRGSGNIGMYGGGGSIIGTYGGGGGTSGGGGHLHGSSGGSGHLHGSSGGSGHLHGSSGGSGHLHGSSGGSGNIGMYGGGGHMNGGSGGTIGTYGGGSAMHGGGSGASGRVQGGHSTSSRGTCDGGIRVNKGSRAGDGKAAGQSKRTNGGSSQTTDDRERVSRTMKSHSNKSSGTRAGVVRRNGAGLRRTIAVGQYGRGGTGAGSAMHSDCSKRNGNVTPEVMYPSDHDSTKRLIAEKSKLAQNIESTSKRRNQSSTEAKKPVTAASESGCPTAKVSSGDIMGTDGKSVGTKSKKETTVVHPEKKPFEGSKAHKGGSGNDTETEQDPTARTKRVAASTGKLPGKANKGRELPSSESRDVHTPPTRIKEDRATGKSNTESNSDTCTRGGGGTRKGTGNPLGFLEHTTSKHDSDPSFEKEPKSYGYLLGEALGEEVRHLDHREKKTSNDKPSRITIPSDREAAKKLLAHKLKPLKEELDSMESSSGESGLCGESASGNGMKTSAETKKLMATALQANSPRAQSKMAVDGGTKPLRTSTMADQSATDNTECSGVVEKPFGASKNIHTLDCFKMGSSRGIKNVKGNIHGFKQ